MELDIERLQDAQIIGFLVFITLGITQLFKDGMKGQPEETKARKLKLIAATVYAVGSFAILLIPTEFLLVFQAIIGGLATSGVYGASKDILGRKESLEAPQA